MLKHWLTTINYPRFIELGANQIVGRISRKEVKNQYKSPTAPNQRKRIIKIGKRK